ncbi:hypothetical protein [Thalassotalea mangrovi]|uniref:Uncharacterized protein n=1 Tax=Thalassotalea mangrovi TaxID=2572245 RepID=A0A4U1B522_9GAMM|nr:hypothetical protein [Thalassotalea mangrovi]TKB45098.1 hypothetical protein E8M12_09690 [Thalassotalea mangrovi]
MNKDVKQLLSKHQSLNQLDGVKVTSHVQREDGDWYLNTVMISGYSVPFKYRRKQMYQSLIGQKVNITYYPATEKIAGMDIEYMKVTRIKRY